MYLILWFSYLAKQFNYLRLGFHICQAVITFPNVFLCINLIVKNVSIQNDIMAFSLISFPVASG